MNFWEYETTYDVYKNRAKDNGVREIMTPSAFYEAEFKHIGLFDGARTSLRSHSVAEYLWYASERPYYRIYPVYAENFRRTKLDVPLRYWPPPYKSFTVRFAIGQEPEVGPYKVRTFMLTAEDDPTKKWRRATTHIQLLKDGLGHGAFVVTGSSATFSLKSDTTAEQYIEDVINKSPRISIDPALSFMTWEQTDPRLWLDFIWRVGLAVSFLATGQDKVIEPDVLNADLRTYSDLVNKRDGARNACEYAAAQTAIENLRRKAAEKRGQPGFTAGRVEALLGRHYGTHLHGPGDNDGNGDGRELRYQHQRGSHFQMYRIGPGRADKEMKFIFQLTVRPDLPPDPRPKGAHTLSK